VFAEVGCGFFWVPFEFHRHNLAGCGLFKNLGTSEEFVEAMQKPVIEELQPDYPGQIIRVGPV
jgi:hypothetical protein